MYFSFDKQEEYIRCRIVSDERGKRFLAEKEKEKII